MNTVLITGANRGIGLGFVKEYLKNDFKVIATCRTLTQSEELTSLSKDYAQRLLVMTLDVSQNVSIHGLATQLKEQEITLDLIINNAGISIEEEFGRWTFENFESNFITNSIGPAILIQTLLPLLNRKAKIIQVSSGMGSIELNINAETGLDAYAVSKATMNMLTRRISSKLHEQEMTIVSISPGWVQTDMGGTEATATVEETIAIMYPTIKNLSKEQSGTFIEANGSIIPW